MKHTTMFPRALVVSFFAAIAGGAFADGAVAFGSSNYIPKSLEANLPKPSPARIDID